MCGIAGVISWDGKYRVTRETLQRMSAAIAHRGPDGEGFYLNLEEEVTPDHPQCGFAFRRLAILDPDPRAMQPFTIGDKTIVFNGEIYNFRELREELKKLRPEYAWRTTGDTEVLLLAYDVWGEQCLERLNGMFAFAVWDEREKGLFLARDRMGQKPLYMTNVPGAGVVAFASELGALTTLPWLPKDHELAALIEYLRWGYVPGYKSIYANVHKLQPGHTYSSRADTETRRYFDPNRALKTVAGRSARILIETAVRRQLVSDVPLGCFLSGGVDSSVIAAAMRTAAGDRGVVHTFSIGFDDPRYDETRYAAAVAKHLGTEHHQFTVKPKAAEDLPRLAAVCGEPFADSSALPTHYLSRESRAHVKVALSGDGGDELFGGYQRYRAMALEARLRRVPKPFRSFLAGSVTEQLPSGHPKSVASAAKRFLRTIDLPSHGRYRSYISLFDDGTIVSLLGLPEGHRLGDGAWVSELRTTFESRSRDAVQAALAFDRSLYLPDDLLTKVDRASMLHGLEVRSPFMDHELVTFAAGLSTDQLLKGGPKRMLREAFADDLPAWVFKRKKMGFAVPIGEWFRGELRAMLRDNLFASDSFARQHFVMPVVERLVDEHEKQTVDHSQRLYALLMLELWWRTSR
jgi:asparagine synthase (glutamine-hydrolysing)